MIFLIFFLFILFNCTDAVQQKQYTTTDTTRKATKKESYSTAESLTDEEQKLRRKEFEEQERLDSLRLLKVLNRVLQYAEWNKNKGSFQHEFEMMPDDTSFSVTTQLVFGNLFENNKKHLLVRRKVPWGAVCDIYLLQNDKFKSVVKRVQDGMTYIDDTTRDVNGDKYNDFLVHWYPSAGCCLADIYNVYLYQPQTGGFTNDYEFINPTFFPEEKIIRGLDYGHPGEAGLYKYKWNKLQVDTIEFVYPYFNQKGKFIKTKKPEYRPTEKEGIVLKSLPNEYKRMDSMAVSWFLDTY